MSKLKETLQDKEQHLRCINYSGNHDKSFIRLLKLDSGCSFERIAAEPEVVIVCEGLLAITLYGLQQYEMPSGKMFFLSPGTPMSVLAKQDLMLVVIRLDMSHQGCTRPGVDSLVQYQNSIGQEFNPLPVRSCIRIFTEGMIPFMEDGLLCSNYLKAKTTEFLHILKSYYPPREQAAFFYPILGEDLIFIGFIEKNIRRVKSVDQLARLHNMSRSGFVDKFEKKMGCKAVPYIRKRRLAMIEADLTNTELPLKEVAAMYGYEHYEVFSKFCKKNLGKSPSDFRPESK